MDYVDANRGPTGAFVSRTHAMQMAVGRFQQELAFLAAECRRQQIPFEWGAVKRTYDDALSQFHPMQMGRPRKDAAVVEKRRTNMFADRDLLKWVNERTEENQLFDESDPVAHAFETGLRILEAVDTHGPVSSSRFPFDGPALLRRYRQALAK